MGKKLYQQFVNARNIFLEISFYHNLKYFKEKFSIFNKKKICARRLSVIVLTGDIIHFMKSQEKETCARKRTVFENTCVKMVNILLDWLSWPNVKTVLFISVNN